MHQNLFTELLGTITLPLFVLIVLAGMAGVKPDVVVKPFMELLGVVLSGIFQILLVALRAFFGATTWAAEETAKNIASGSNDKRERR